MAKILFEAIVDASGAVTGFKRLEQELGALGTANASAAKEASQNDRALQRLLDRLEPSRTAAEKLTRQQEQLAKAYNEGRIQATGNLSAMERYRQLQSTLIDQTAKKTSLTTQLGNELSGMATRYVSVAAAIGAAAAAGRTLIGVLEDSIKKYAESEMAGAKATAIHRATGGGSGYTLAELDQMTAKLSRLTGMDDEAIRAGAAALEQFTNVRTRIFQEAMESATDIARVMGTDVSQAAEQLGRALEDPANAAKNLRAMNILLTAAEKDHIKSLTEEGRAVEAQEAILERVRGAYEGVAETVRGSLQGSLDALTVEWDNLKEAMGESMTNAAGGTSAIADLTEVVRGLGDAMKDAKTEGDMLPGWVSAAGEEARRQALTLLGLQQALAALHATAVMLQTSSPVEEQVPGWMQRWLDGNIAPTSPEGAMAVLGEVDATEAARKAKDAADAEEALKRQKKLQEERIADLRSQLSLSEEMTRQRSTYGQDVAAELEVHKAVGDALARQLEAVGKAADASKVRFDHDKLILEITKQTTAEQAKDVAEIKRANEELEKLVLKGGALGITLAKATVDPSLAEKTLAGARAAYESPQWKQLEEDLRKGVAAAITDGIIIGITGGDSAEIGKGFSRMLTQITARSLDTIFGELMAGKNGRQAFQAAGILNADTYDAQGNLVAKGGVNWGGALQMGGGMVMQYGQQRNNTTAGALGGAMSGAGAGMAFGPWGAVIGAIIGGVMGYLSSQSKKTDVNIIKPGWVETSDTDPATGEVSSYKWWRDFKVDVSGIDQEAEDQLVKQWKDKIKRLNTQFRDVFFELREAVPDFAAWFPSINASVSDFSSWWRALFEQTLPDQLFATVRPGIEAGLEGMGVSEERIAQLMGEFGEGTYDSAIAALIEFIQTLNALTEASGDYGKSLETLREEVSRSPFEQWEAGLADTHEMLARLGQGLGELTSEEQVARAKQILEVTQAQYQANLQMLAALEGMRTAAGEQYSSFLESREARDAQAGGWGATDAFLRRKYGEAVGGITAAETPEDAQKAWQNAMRYAQALMELADAMEAALPAFDAAKAAFDDLEETITSGFAKTVEEFNQSTAERFAAGNAATVARIAELRDGLAALAPQDFIDRVNEIGDLARQQYEANVQYLETILQMQRQLAESFAAQQAQWAYDDASRGGVVGRGTFAGQRFGEALATINAAAANPGAFTPEQVQQAAQDAMRWANELRAVRDELEQLVEALGELGTKFAALEVDLGKTLPELIADVNAGWAEGMAATLQQIGDLRTTLDPANPEAYVATLGQIEQLTRQQYEANLAYLGRILQLQQQIAAAFAATSEQWSYEDATRGGLGSRAGFALGRYNAAAGTLAAAAAGQGAFTPEQIQQAAQDAMRWANELRSVRDAIEQTIAAFEEARQTIVDLEETISTGFAKTVEDFARSSTGRFADSNAETLARIAALSEGLDSLAPDELLARVQQIGDLTRQQYEANLAYLQTILQSQRQIRDSFNQMVADWTYQDVSRLGIGERSGYALGRYNAAAGTLAAAAANPDAFSPEEIQQAAQDAMRWANELRAVRDELEQLVETLGEMRGRFEALEADLGKTLPDLVADLTAGWAEGMAATLQQIGDLRLQLDPARPAEYIEQLGQIEALTRQQYEANLAYLRTILDTQRQVAESFSALSDQWAWEDAQRRGTTAAFGYAVNQYAGARGRISTATSPQELAAATQDLQRWAQELRNLSQQIEQSIQQLADLGASFAQLQADLQTPFSALVDSITETSRAAFERGNDETVAKVAELRQGLSSLAPDELVGRLGQIRDLERQRFDENVAYLRSILSIQESLSASFDSLFAQWDEAEAAKGGKANLGQWYVGEMQKLWEQLQSPDLGPEQVQALITKMQGYASKLYGLDADVQVDAGEGLVDVLAWLRPFMEQVRELGDTRLDEMGQAVESENNRLRDAIAGITGIIETQSGELQTVLRAINAILSLGLPAAAAAAQAALDAMADAVVAANGTLLASLAGLTAQIGDTQTGLTAMVIALNAALAGIPSAASDADTALQALAAAVEDANTGLLGALAGLAPALAAGTTELTATLALVNAALATLPSTAADAGQALQGLADAVVDANAELATAIAGLTAQIGTTQTGFGLVVASLDTYLGQLGVTAERVDAALGGMATQVDAANTALLASLDGLSAGITTKRTELETAIASIRDLITGEGGLGDALEDFDEVIAAFQQRIRDENTGLQGAIDAMIAALSDAAFDIASLFPENPEDGEEPPPEDPPPDDGVNSVGGGPIVTAAVVAESADAHAANTSAVAANVVVMHEFSSAVVRAVAAMEALASAHDSYSRAMQRGAVVVNAGVGR